jgi:hypothetical protein
MATNTIAQMRMRRTQLEMERASLQAEAKGLCRSITDILVPVLFEVEEMDVARAAAYMDDLVVKQAELLALQRKLWEIERAIG